MNIILFLPRALYKMYCVVLFILTFLPFYPFFRLSLSRKKWFKYTFKLKRAHSLVLQLIGGIWLSVEKKAELPEGPFIICPNHSSYTDIILLYRAIDKYFVYMGKRQIEKVPLFRDFFTKGMDIFVDRENTRDSHRALQNAGERLDQGDPVVIFPEGTIPKGAPVMKAFKNGAFKLAIEKQVPIIPVTFTRNWALIQGTVLFKGKAGPGYSKAIIHPPIYTTGLTEEDLQTLRLRVRETINQPLIEKYGALIN